MPLTNPQATVGLPLDAVIPGVIQALPLPVNDASHALLNGRFRPALRTVMREAESDIVIRDSTLLIYPGISHRAMVPASNAALHAAAKDEHVTAFGTLLSALPGFSLQGEDRYMFAFHAGLDPNTHTPRAFFITEWNELVEQIRTYLPAGRARAITLDLVAYIVMSMMQMLAFTPDTDGARARALLSRTLPSLCAAALTVPIGVLCYGKRNREVGSPARFADIKAWLLDADACPTAWAPLLAIRRAAAA